MYYLALAEEIGTVFPQSSYIPSQFSTYAEEIKALVDKLEKIIDSDKIEKKLNSEQMTIIVNHLAEARKHIILANSEF